LIVRRRPGAVGIERLPPAKEDAAAFTRSLITAAKSLVVRRALVTEVGQPVKSPLAVTQAVVSFQKTFGSSTRIVRVTVCVVPSVSTTLRVTV
jgi:hypothetical protein